MSVLFVVSRLQKTSTVFDTAARMAEKGHEILFLFTRDGCQHVTDPELVGSMTYAKGLHCLEQDCASEELRRRLVRGVKPITYSDWVELLEQCDTVVSWS